MASRARFPKTSKTKNMLFVNAPLLYGGSENATHLSHLFTPPQLYLLLSYLNRFFKLYLSSSQLPSFRLRVSARHLLGTFINFLQGPFPRSAMSNSNSPTPHVVVEAVRQFTASSPSEFTPCLRGHPIGWLRMLTNVPEFLLSYSSALIRNLNIYLEQSQSLARRAISSPTKQLI